MTLFALAMLMTLNVNMLRTTATNGETIMKGKIGLAAISISTSLIEEAQRKNFDEIAAHDTVINSLNLISAVTALGPESGESYNTFDDFDDYNRYTVKFATSLPETLFAKCAVVYVSPTNPDVASTVKTWSKKMTVSVTSPTLEDTVKSTYVYSYWYFR